jgi:FKBP-type peptidyl-prolyl cis-trans isomerase 2
VARAKLWDTVKVHYTCFSEDGSLVDTTLNGNPIKFTIGKGQIMNSFEEAVLGMREEESKTIKCPMEKAFGPHKDENVLVIKRDKLSIHHDFKVGQKLEMKMESQKLVVTIIDVTESTVTLDANHPLSGKNLTFNIKLVEIAQ